MSFRGILRTIINVPVVWDTAQNFLGYEPWKARMYPGVFDEKKGKLLDFGCSIGNTTKEFLEFDYTGVDLDQAAIEVAKERYGKHPNVRFFARDILTEPLSGESFDHVLFAGTGHHISDAELPAIIDALLAHLRPGGQLHFLDHIRTPLRDGLIARAIIRFDQGRFIRTADAYDRFFDPKRYAVKKRDVIPSPDRFIKLPNFLYIRVVRED